MLTLWDLLPKPKRPKPPAHPRPREGVHAINPPHQPRPAPEPTVAPRPQPTGANGEDNHAHDPVPLICTQISPPAPATPDAPREPMAARYLRMQREMLRLHHVRVRKWRSSSSGVAWQVFYRDGSVSRLIESPRPRGPVSAAIFLHEIGHHAIGFGIHKPRCLEEYLAWQFALEHMHAYAITVTPAVESRVRESLQYAVAKARRRGLKNIPLQLLPYLNPQ